MVCQLGYEIIHLHSSTLIHGFSCRYLGKTQNTYRLRVFKKGHNESKKYWQYSKYTEECLYAI